MLIRSIRSKLEEDGALFDSGFDGGEPFRVTPEAGGVSLESALRDYGPAAIDDLIPRLGAIARDLDAAHAAGHVHGALHPSRVIVHDEATSLIKGTAPLAPYAAPEMADGPATPASDQFALAAIAYEWLFGRPINHPADRPVDVRTMPGVDRVTLSKAFTRALAPSPNDRFASCTQFCRAVANAVVPALPLLALDTGDDLDDPVGPFLPERVDVGHDHLPPAEDWSFDSRANAPLAQDRPFDLRHDTVPLAQDKPVETTQERASLNRPALSVDDDATGPEDSLLIAAQPDRDTIGPRITTPAAVASWNPHTTLGAPGTRESQRFGGLALILAAIVGSLFGFAAGYMARPRALQTSTPAPVVETTGGPGASEASGASRATAANAAKPQDARGDGNAPSAPTAASTGRLLVRSSPAGASVSVDGVAKGVTPVALRDLELGTRNIVIARPGYVPETRTVVITSARPARSLDVRLSAAAATSVSSAESRAKAVGGGSAKISPKLGKPATPTGSMNIESRPAGATVMINGKPSGHTPLTLTDLAPGEYRIVMAMPGYRDFTTTVRVIAGERVRAAASLTVQEQE